MTSPVGASGGAERTLGGPLCATALALSMFIEAVGYGMVAPTLPFLAKRHGADETDGDDQLEEREGCMALVEAFSVRHQLLYRMLETA